MRISQTIFGSVMAMMALASIAPAEDLPNAAEKKGALAGASIFVNPGHGWLWNDERGTWNTQRGLNLGIIEDHSNAEAVLQYLIPELERAGATVYSARERCLNTNEVILEAGDAGVSMEGNWALEYVPGSHGGSQLQAKSVSGVADARVVYTPEIPEAGNYAVYTWYAPAVGSPTATDTRFLIDHSGGRTLWVQDQNHDDSTWKYLGTYWFEAGTAGSVTIENQSATADATTIAGAVRFGGGMSDTIRGGKTSGKPRWEESGLYNVQFMGYQALGETRRFNSVSAMPMWAEWECEPHEKGKSMYVAWHTNASGNGSRGMSSYIYGPNSWGSQEEFTGFPGGKDLCFLVHDRVVDAIHHDYNPDWRDIGVICRWLGETNPRNNNRMPAALFEYGFHDQADDAAMILDPQFRRLASRATVQGIIEFYKNHMDGFDIGTMPPEPPQAVQLVRNGDTATITWLAPEFDGEDGPLGDEATGYRVYTSRNGKGFDNGRDVQDTTWTLDGLTAGEARYLRVTATNEGGESLPSEVLAVLPGDSGKLLLVNGFDRLDSGLNLDVGGNRRGILEKMNTADYAIEYTNALVGSGLAIDSASNEALTSGTVTLSGYDAVVWSLGQENDEDALREADKAAIRDYLDNGGRVIVSGASAASAMVAKEDGFVTGTLGLKTAVAGPARRKVRGVDGTPFEGLAFTLDDGTGVTYPVTATDTLTPAKNAEAVLVYTDGGETAGVAVDRHAITFGFPIETVNEPDQRERLLGAAMSMLTGKSVESASAGQ